MTTKKIQSHETDIAQEASTMETIKRNPIGRPRIAPALKRNKPVMSYFTSTDLGGLKNLATARGISISHLVHDAALRELARAVGKTGRMMNSDGSYRHIQDGISAEDAMLTDRQKDRRLNKG